MVDAVGSVTKIVEVALKIKAAVDTARQNKEVCIQIKMRVNRLSAILLQLSMEVMKEPATRDTLLELEGTLLRALGLVTSCQERNNMSLAFTAGKLSKHLHQVKQDISDQMMEVILATNVHVTVMITRHYQDGVHPAPPRSEVNGEKVDATLSGGTSTGSPHSFFEDEVTPYWTSQGEATANCFPESVDTPNYLFKSEATPKYLFESEASSNFGWSAREKRKTDPILSCFTSFSFSELEAATNNFSKEHVIGKGGSATVYQGVLPDGLMVAIKRFHDPWGPQSVKQYVGVFSDLLDHKNVVRFLGCCHEDRREIVVEEYMPKGNLSGIIDGSSQKLDWPSTFRIIREIAQGLVYLHRKNIIHMDLKPDNILFDSHMNPKICDFGSSVKLGQWVTETVTDELVGTMGFIPPEYLADGIISVKNDVYSFGVLLLCIISGKSRSTGQDSNDISIMTKPRSCHDSINWAWDVRKTGRMKELVDPSLRDESHVKQRERCMEIGLLCTQDCIFRPTMREVLWMLNGKEKLPTPERNKVPSKMRQILRPLLAWLSWLARQAWLLPLFLLIFALWWLEKDTEDDS